jgi:uncharacterized protein YraI
MTTQTDLIVAERAIQSLPLNEQAQCFLRARLYQCSGLPEKAIIELEKLASQGGGPGLVQALGGAYYQAGLLDQAKANYTAALDEATLRGDPISQAEAHLGLGHIAKAKSNMDTAIVHWQAGETLYRQEGYLAQAGQIAALLLPAKVKPLGRFWLINPVGRLDVWMKKVWPGTIGPANRPTEPKPIRPMKWRRAVTLRVAFFLRSLPLIVFLALIAGVYLLQPIEEVAPAPTPTIPLSNPTPTDVITPANTPIPAPTNIAASTVQVTPDPPTGTAVVPDHSDTPLPTGTSIPTLIMTPTATTPIFISGIVAADRLNLRTGPSINYPSLGILLRNDELIILRRTPRADWLEIKTLIGKIGWVVSEYVEISAGTDIALIPLATMITSLPTTIATLTTNVMLLDPPDRAVQFRNRLELNWNWPRTLGADDYFQVKIWNKYNAPSGVIDESVPPIEVAWVKDRFFLFDRVEEAYSSEYKWQVTAVRGIPPQQKQWSTPKYRAWEPGTQVEQIGQASVMRTVYLEAAAALPPPAACCGGLPPDERR